MLHGPFQACAMLTEAEIPVPPIARRTSMGMARSPSRTPSFCSVISAALQIAAPTSTEMGKSPPPTCCSFWAPSGKCATKASPHSTPKSPAMRGFLFVPGAGLEPARPYGPTDFKSVVSTNSTIRAEPRSSKRKMEKRSRSAQNTSVVTPSGSRPNVYPSKPSQQTGHWFRIAGRWTANFHPYPGDTPAGRPYQVASLRRA